MPIAPGVLFQPQPTSRTRFPTVGPGLGKDALSIGPGRFIVKRKKGRRCDDLGLDELIPFPNALGPRPQNQIQA